MKRLLIIMLLIPLMASAKSRIHNPQIRSLQVVVNQDWLSPAVMRLGTDDVLNMFGRDTVLETWLVNDGYGLGAKTEDIVLDKYHATRCGNHLYLTDVDFTEDAMTALVDRYQSDPAFNPDCIVLFGYSFGHNAMDMLEKNKPTINLVKDKNIIIDVRY